MGWIAIGPRVLIYLFCNLEKSVYISTFSPLLNMAKQLKRELANQLLHAIGFQHMQDKDTIVFNENLEPGIQFLKNKKVIFSCTFKGSVRKRLQKPIKSASDVIKIVRMVLKDKMIQKGIYSIKHNRFKHGKHVTIYSYRLLH